MTATRPGSRVSPALHALLGGAIDYAGLFPPAALGMRAAVTEYASYLDGPDAWALGRFVLPVARLGELSEASPPAGAPWRLSALLSDDVAGDAERVRRWNEARDATATRAGAWTAVIGAVELRAATESDVRSALGTVDPSLERYVEVPVTPDPATLLRAIAREGGRAKVRTGGVTADAVPASDDLLRFLEACVSERLAFKATAGLHHPLRATYRLTYAPDSPRGTMFGFLNVFLATALLVAGAHRQLALAVLEETDARSLRFDAHGATWRGHALTLEQIAEARAISIASFGSCSFREPIDELAVAGLA